CSSDLVTFANRYYMEISLINDAVRVIDLNTISEFKLRIVKSNLSIHHAKLFFIGRSEKEPFDKYFGVFDIASGTITDINRGDKDGFFGNPPLYGTRIYAVLSTERVLYKKTFDS